MAKGTGRGKGACGGKRKLNGSGGGTGQSSAARKSQAAKPKK